MPKLACYLSLKRLYATRNQKRNFTCFRTVDQLKRLEEHQHVCGHLTKRCSIGFRINNHDFS
eukprot:m.178032 g.178032  ORF g.178032 m.178032 type:complete len:62 (-) comp16583_c0_seq3:1066-1251(-)